MVILGWIAKDFNYKRTSNISDSRRAVNGGEGYDVIVSAPSVKCYTNISISRTSRKEVRELHREDLCEPKNTSWNITSRTSLCRERDRKETS